MRRLVILVLVSYAGLHADSKSDFGVVFTTMHAVRKEAGTLRALPVGLNGCGGVMAGIALGSMAGGALLNVVPEVTGALAGLESTLDDALRSAFVGDDALRTTLAIDDAASAVGKTNRATGMIARGITAVQRIVSPWEDDLFAIFSKAKVNPSIQQALKTVITETNVQELASLQQLYEKIAETSIPQGVAQEVAQGMKDAIVSQLRTVLTPYHDELIKVFASMLETPMDVERALVELPGVARVVAATSGKASAVKQALTRAGIAAGSVAGVGAVLGTQLSMVNDCYESVIKDLGLTIDAADLGGAYLWIDNLTGKDIKITIRRAGIPEKVSKSLPAGSITKLLGLDSLVTYGVDIEAPGLGKATWDWHARPVVVNQVFHATARSQGGKLLIEETDKAAMDSAPIAPTA